MDYFLCRMILLICGIYSSWKYFSIVHTGISIIHNYNTQKKLNFHVQHCNAALFNSVINMGISLYNKVPDQIKLREKYLESKTVIVVRRDLLLGDN
jgi:hypothetical protein